MLSNQIASGGPLFTKRQCMTGKERRYKMKLYLAEVSADQVTRSPLDLLPLTVSPINRVSSIVAYVNIFAVSFSTRHRTYGGPQ